MSSGLLALLDDVAAIAKVAAASVDDLAGLAAKAGAKSAGVVIDDAAVTPRFVVGFAASRELPIVYRIAKGSLRNKLLILLPLSLALSYLAPWSITPLLMLGGLFLCFEGAEKVVEIAFPHAGHGDEAAAEESVGTPEALEEQRVASAIKTDFILSAEIMAIALGTSPEASLAQQAVVLALVAVGITALVYGAVAVIVKADDVGLALAGRRTTSSFGRLTQSFGRGLVLVTPKVLALLSTLGMAAMLLVGGGILLHGFETMGAGGPAHALHEFAEALGARTPASALVSWTVSSLVTMIVGFVVGLAVIPVATRVIGPLIALVRRPRTA